jgi:hypothetical protein
LRHPVVDELEERRVVRRLSGLAEAVEPLPDSELAAILSGVSSGRLGRRPASGLRTQVWRRLPGAAAALAAALAIAVGIGQAERSFDGPEERGTAPVQLLSFPEGSALELLLSRAAEDRPA